MQGEEPESSECLGERLAKRAVCVLPLLGLHGLRWLLLIARLAVCPLLALCLFVFCGLHAASPSPQHHITACLLLQPTVRQHCGSSAESTSKDSFRFLSLQVGERQMHMRGLP